MDLREIGNLFMVGFQGTRFSAEVRDLVDDLNPCGVIHFSRNIENPLQTAEMNRDLQDHVLQRSGQGLFIGVDQEGGRVRRLLEPFTGFPAAFRLARAGEPDEAVREFARVTAREIRLVGFNLDFVPVLDVLRDMVDLESSVIGDRSYGFDPRTVSRLGGIVVETMRESGVIPCGKHFPGHGGTAVDSHVDLPEDDRTAETLARADLIPFRDAAASHVEMIMTAHVLYRDLDETYPATLSHRIISGMLRDGMSYNGVVITDDLDMGAVANRFTMEESVIAAINAGVDILLVCHSDEKALSARSALAEAVRHGQVSEAAVRKSLHRIRSLKTAYADSLLPGEAAPVTEYFKV